MGWKVENYSPLKIRIDDSRGNVDYYYKTNLSVRADSGNIVIANGNIDVFNQNPSDIDLPNMNGVQDLVNKIDEYISDNGSGAGTLYGNVILVEDLTDLPAPVSNVIILRDETVYEISGVVDIGENRLLMGVNTTLRGNSPALDYITSDTTGALITSTTSFRIIMCGFKASSGSIFAVSGTGVEICFMHNVRFFGTGTLGTVSDFDLFEVTSGLFVGFSGGLTLSGSNVSLIMIDTEFFQTSGTPTSLDLGTSTWNLIRLLGCSFTVVSGGTGLSVAANGANLNSGYKGIVQACSFTGAGTLISGYSALDEEWAMGVGNVGITPSDRFEPSGWAYYADAESSPATQSLNTTFQKLQIDGAGAATYTAALPSVIRGSGTLWDTTNDKITPISVKDSYELRIDLEISATGGGASALYLQLDIGGGATPTNVVVDRVISYGKSAPFTVSVGFPIYCLSTFVTNGGQIFIATDAGTSTLATRGIMIARLSSGAI